MATPILTASPSTISLTPGSTATVFVEASDPDAGTTTLRIRGTDQEGNAAEVLVTVQKLDGIVTWSAVVDDPDLVAAVQSSSGVEATVVVSWPSS